MPEKRKKHGKKTRMSSLKLFIVFVVSIALLLLAPQFAAFHRAEISETFEGRVPTDVPDAVHPPKREPSDQVGSASANQVDNPEKKSFNSTWLPDERSFENRPRDCPRRRLRLSSWGSVVKEDMKLIRKKSGRVAMACRQYGAGALRFEINLKTVSKVEGHAYEIFFPEYIVADERGANGYFRHRSTVQLFLQSKKDHANGEVLLGPAHAEHEFISNQGNGAYSHWRPPLTSGVQDHISQLRFSTPGNLPLAKFTKLIVVVFPMAPTLGWVEFLHTPNTKAKNYDPYKRRRRKELFREMYLETFLTVGVEPDLIDEPSLVKPYAWYFWRVSHHDEFDITLGPGEKYETQMPLQFARHFRRFERNGARLWPPPSNYLYYENKVTLTDLFRKSGVKIPTTWIFSSITEARRAQKELNYPVIVKDPFGYSSKGLRQAAHETEFIDVIDTFFSEQPNGTALVQSKVRPAREARITYVDGRPFHGYWRIRNNASSASAASTAGGFQDFDFPLSRFGSFVDRFASNTGIVVGGADFMWEEPEPTAESEPYTLEVSPTSDINPAPPRSWNRTYAEFKKEPSFRKAYLDVRRQWTDAMVLAVIDRHRCQRRHLFVDLDGVLTSSRLEAKLWTSEKERSDSVANLLDYSAAPDAVHAMQQLKKAFFVRIFAQRGNYGEAFNVSLTWLHGNGFVFDDVLLLNDPFHRLAHLSDDAILVSSTSSEIEDELFRRNISFVRFPNNEGSSSSGWQRLLPVLLSKARN